MNNIEQLPFWPAIVGELYRRAEVAIDYRHSNARSVDAGHCYGIFIPAMSE
jgi:hypothetical protein